jgi:hypothetical protein
MKKNVVLLLLAINLFVSYADAVDKNEVENPYEGNVFVDVEGWTIISSPLDGTGVKLFLRGDAESEEVIIDIERSFNSTDYRFMKFLNSAADVVSNCMGGSYKVSYYQLVVMIALAGQTPYTWDTCDVGPITRAWWINFVNLEANVFPFTCVENFKNKFPNCKRLILQLSSSNQKIILKETKEVSEILSNLQHFGVELFVDDKKEA